MTGQGAELDRLFTSPFGGEAAASRRVRGPSTFAEHGKGPLVRAKTVELFPQGKVKRALP